MMSLRRGSGARNADSETTPADTTRARFDVMGAPFEDNRGKANAAMGQSHLCSTKAAASAHISRLSTPFPQWLTLTRRALLVVARPVSSDRNLNKAPHRS